MRKLPIPFRVLALSLALVACGDDDDTEPVDVVVMTRNVFLGADLGPAIAAGSVSEFVAANGGILRQVAATDFATRARGLAAEILEVQPDLVGLQEVALWRTGPTTVEPLFGVPPKASTVRYDFLELLLAELNADGPRYEAVVVQEEFDFEAPADENQQPGDGFSPVDDAELNGRLTMRDVILRRLDADVSVSNARSGHFENLHEVSVAGVTLPIVRGWTSVDARVRGSRRFRFVNTHLESFDPRTEVPSVRARQAAELFARGGPADADHPVVLVGDLNSDDDTVGGGDEQAYETLLAAGFVSVSTSDPLSCCIGSDTLQDGDVSEFDHQVDHILTNSPDAVQLVRSGVTGREMQNGFWNSDHAGVWSVLRIR